jgi:hypothetical protein
MSIVSIKEMPSRSFQLNSSWERTYKRTFQVITNNRYDTAVDVFEEVAITIADVHPLDAFAYCLTVDINCVTEDGIGWTAQYDYGPPPDPGNPDNQDPTQQPPEFSWTGIQFERPVDFDRDGKAIVNKAGDVFQTPVMRDDSRPMLQVVRNQLTFNPSLAWRLRDVVNSSEFLGAPAGKVKSSYPTASRRWSNEYGFYWVVTYQFTFDSDGFSKKLLNQGLREKAEDELKNIVVQGVPITEPVLLTEDGEQAEPDAPPVVLEFEVYNETDFSVFNLE